MRRSGQGRAGPGGRQGKNSAKIQSATTEFGNPPEAANRPAVSNPTVINGPTQIDPHGLQMGSRFIN